MSYIFRWNIGAPNLKLFRYVNLFLFLNATLQVLERDLAVFGIFVALGRSTKSFLAANGFDKIPEPIEGFIRYFLFITT